MYMHGMSARALHMRTSIATHRQAHERPAAAAAAVVATPRGATAVVSDGGDERAT